MFLEYYGLREQPFGVTPNPRYLYHSAMHREALASLIYGIESDLGFAALIANPGMGKTTLLFYLLEKFRNTARTALIFQTLCTPVELLRYLANELEIKTKETDAVSLNEQIKDVLVREARAKRRVIVIIDEAQNLDESVLETVRLLSDFETQNTKLMHIILAGQLQLAEKLARPGMAQLLQRVSMLNRLTALSAEETKNYIEYRLGVAGYRGAAIFTPEAFRRIAEMSGGVPRKINRICFNALSLGCAMGQKCVDAAVIGEVGNDLDIGDLLFQKGAIADEAKEQSVTRVQPTTIPVQRTTENTVVAECSPRIETTSVAEPPEIPAQLDNPIGATGTSKVLRPWPTYPQSGPSDLPVAQAQSVLRVAEASSPSVAATTVSGHVRPFVAPTVAGGGIARPLSSAQAKPLAVPVLAPTPAAAPMVIPAKPPIPIRVQQPASVRSGQPAKSSRPAIVASGSVLLGVIVFAGWTLWGNVGGRATNAQSTLTAPQRSVHESEMPVVSSPAINEAIERGRTSAKEQDQDAGPQNDAVKVPVGRSRQEHRQVAEAHSTTLHLAPQTFQSGDRAISAALIKKVQPVYPAEARRSGVQGSVTVAAVIGTDGKPRNVRAVSGNPILAKAATEAVSQWLYAPYSVNGRPVEVETEVVVDFALR